MTATLSASYISAQTSSEAAADTAAAYSTVALLSLLTRHYN